MALAIIGGTGLDSLKLIEDARQEQVNTPYGEPSAPITLGKLYGADIMFLPRHGAQHQFPPHKVNYRANLWALQQLGAKDVLAVAAVGGITSQMGPTVLAVPDQIIDYTWGREHTYFDGGNGEVKHVDFTAPYCRALRQRLLEAARRAEVDIVDGGTYGATQGPRLETPAEIARMERDGCDMVGMTGMPEAILARELDLCYACCAVVANWAAGKEEGEISMSEIEAYLAIAMANVSKLLEQLQAVA